LAVVAVVVAMELVAMVVVAAAAQVAYQLVQ